MCNETEPNVEELRARARNGIESYKTGYRAGLAESEQELGLAKLTIEQLKTRIANQDLHIAMLEATILRTGLTVETDPAVAFTDPKEKGYRPPCCDHKGGDDSACCDFECAANRELREMGLLK